MTLAEDLTLFHLPDPTALWSCGGVAHRRDLAVSFSWTRATARDVSPASITTARSQPSSLPCVRACVRAYDQYGNADNHQTRLVDGNRNVAKKRNALFYPKGFAYPSASPASIAMQGEDFLFSLWRRQRGGGTASAKSALPGKSNLAARRANRILFAPSVASVRGHLITKPSLPLKDPRSLVALLLLCCA